MEATKGTPERTRSASGGSSARRRRALRRFLLGLVGLLFVLSIPWYRPPAETPPLLFGLPDWVAVSLACYVGVAVLNALAWALTEVADGGPNDPADGS